MTWFYWAEGWEWRWLEIVALVGGMIGLAIYYFVLGDYGRDVRAKLAAVDNGSNE